MDIKSEIVVLIDLNAFNDSNASDVLLDNVKEAISFQITQGVTTKLKLYKLGLEPNLARVHWTYIFFDSTIAKQQNDTTTARPLQSLSFDSWNVFEEKFNKIVKSYTPKGTCISSNRQMQNIAHAIHVHKSLYKVEDNSLSNNCQSTRNAIEKKLLVITRFPVSVPDLFSLAVAIDDETHSSPNGTNSDINPLFVDVENHDVTAVRSITAGTIRKNFWDELLELVDIQSYSHNLSLKISCLKKLMNIHKLWEMIFPALFSCRGTVSGFGIGMKRLKHLEWVNTNRHPPQLVTNALRETGCLSIDHCWAWADS